MSPSTPDRTYPPDGHPTDRQLSDYQDDRLSPAEEDEIQEHLVACPDCREALLSLAEFQELMETEELATTAGASHLPSASQTEASWQRMRARLSAGRPEVLPTPAPAPPPTHRPRRRTISRPVLALAASLAACLIGFPLWIATHGSSGALIVLPPLDRGEVARGSATEPATVRLAEAPALVALALPPRASYPAYRLEVRTPRGDLLLTSPGAPIPTAMAPGPQPSTAGARPLRLLALALGRDQLPPGDYRLRLVGLRGSRGEVLSEYPLRVPRT
jgi:hypothetical protein